MLLSYKPSLNVFSASVLQSIRCLVRMPALRMLPRFKNHAMPVWSVVSLHMVRDIGGPFQAVVAEWTKSQLPTQVFFVKISLVIKGHWDRNQPTSNSRASDQPHTAFTSQNSRNQQLQGLQTSQNHRNQQLKGLQTSQNLRNQQRTQERNLNRRYSRGSSSGLS